MILNTDESNEKCPLKMTNIQQKEYFQKHNQLHAWLIRTSKRYTTHTKKVALETDWSLTANLLCKFQLNIFYGLQIAWIYIFKLEKQLLIRVCTVFQVGHYGSPALMLKMFIVYQTFTKRAKLLGNFVHFLPKKKKKKSKKKKKNASHSR